MHKTKYSVVLPVLNGAETLPTTLRHLLSINYDNFEVVVSDNLSSDATQEILSEISDPRLKVVRPDKRLGWSENLAFAYSHANGLWQHHIGDDDVIMPSRFKMLDQLLELYPDSEVLWCRAYRYHWPTYGEQSLAHCMDPISFSGGHMALNESARDCIIRGVRVDAGQSYVVSKNVIDKCQQQYGFYVSKQHGEAFSYRAAFMNALKITLLDVPLGINGRHSKSIATQHLQSKEHYKVKGETDIAYSDPDVFSYTPWKYKGYVSWSLDALCLLSRIEEKVPALNDIEWVLWAYRTIGEIKSLSQKGQLNLSEDFIRYSLEIYRKDLLAIWEKRSFDNVKEYIALISDNTPWPEPRKTLSFPIKDNLISLPFMDVRSWGVNNISELAYKLEEKLPLVYGTDKVTQNLNKMTSVSDLNDKLNKLIQLQNILIENGLPHSTTDSVVIADDDSSVVAEIPQYIKKYDEFLNSLNNYYYRAGNRCNAPVINSYEFNDLDSFLSEGAKQRRKRLPIPENNPCMGSPDKYNTLLGKLREMKNGCSEISAIIIGNGPSQEMLSYEGLEAFKEQGNHIYALNLLTTNGAFPLHCVTHYITSDYQAFSSDLGPPLSKKQDLLIDYINKFKPEIFIPIDREFELLKSHWNVTYFEDRHLNAWEGGGWQPDKPRRYWSNTLLKALAISRYLGYRKVYVIGADTSYPHCIRSAPDNDLAIVESHAYTQDRLTQGYPLSTSMSKYMTLLSYWFWSYGYICDKRFINLDPLSLVDTIKKLDLTTTEGWGLLNETAEQYVRRVLTSYLKRDKTPV